MELFVVQLFCNVFYFKRDVDNDDVSEDIFSSECGLQGEYL